MRKVLNLRISIVIGVKLKQLSFVFLFSFNMIGTE